MAEPTSSLMAKAATLTPPGWVVTITITGTVFGLDIESLIIGMAAAFLSVMIMPKFDSRRAAAAAVVLSSLLAAVCAPLFAGYLIASVDMLAKASPDALQLGLTVLIGASGPPLLPVALLRLQTQAKEVKL